jgi:hypothetical protein
MNSLRKLERDFVHADMAAVTALLAQLGDEDVMTRFGLQARLEELRETIARFGVEPDEAAASAALFFGGRPVIGSHGIESEFATEAIAKFQDIVGKVLAHDNGGLGRRGIVPNKSAAVLHITNIVRGSFGFLLEELKTQQQMLETSLKVAVDETTRLLDAFGEPNEENFRSAVEEIDERVLETARDFFDLMRQSGATLRLVAGETDRSFGAEAVSRAAERATSTSVETSEETIGGQLTGMLPEGHLFEFRRAGEGGGILRGKVDRAIPTDELAGFNRNLIGVDSIARMLIKRVRRNGTVVREGLILLGISDSRSLGATGGAR